MTTAEFLQKLWDALLYCLLNGAGNNGGAMLAVMSWLGLVALICAFIAPIVKLVMLFNRDK